MLNLEEGKEVVKLARSTIEHYLEEGEKPSPPENPGDFMENERGVFVTLKKDDKLRGCIGRPLPTQSILKGTMNSTISASAKDPRFRRLKKEELDDVTVEVTILTPPEKIETETPEDYPEEIEVGRNGLIVEGSGREGLLLPQVPVEQGWGSKEFLSQTCAKAGLPSDSWLEGKLDIKKFSGQVFKEKEPNGEILEKSLS